MKVARSVAEVLNEHVTLEVECIDRLYLNLYIPILQCERGVGHFWINHRGHRFATSSLMAPMTKAFVSSIERFADQEGHNPARPSSTARPKAGQVMPTVPAATTRPAGPPARGRASRVLPCSLKSLPSRPRCVRGRRARPTRRCRHAHAQSAPTSTATSLDMAFARTVTTLRRVRGAPVQHVRKSTRPVSRTDPRSPAGKRLCSAHDNVNAIGPGRSAIAPPGRRSSASWRI